VFISWYNALIIPARTLRSWVDRNTKFPKLHFRFVNLFSSLNHLFVFFLYFCIPCLTASIPFTPFHRTHFFFPPYIPLPLSRFFRVSYLSTTFPFFHLLTYSLFLRFPPTPHCTLNALFNSVSIFTSLSIYLLTLICFVLSPLFTSKTAEDANTCNCDGLHLMTNMQCVEMLCLPKRRNLYLHNGVHYKIHVCRMLCLLCVYKIVIFKGTLNRMEHTQEGWYVLSPTRKETSYSDRRFMMFI
jgi:hypothetical protein